MDKEDVRKAPDLPPPPDPRPVRHLSRAVLVQKRVVEGALVARDLCPARAGAGVELRLELVNEFLDTGDDGNGPQRNSLARISGPDVSVELHDVQVTSYFDSDGPAFDGLPWYTVVLETPGHNCGRCSSMFRVLPPEEGPKP